MGSVALLTREGEVEIAKEIEDGEREIILSSLSSVHALREITRLKEKVEHAENQVEFVKDLVRGLDDDSTAEQVETTKKTIYEVCESIRNLLDKNQHHDSAQLSLSAEQKVQFQEISDKLVGLTFNL